MRVFCNGSIVGTDDYAASKRLYTKPSQMLLVFDGDNVVHYSINLDIQCIIYDRKEIKLYELNLKTQRKWFFVYIS